MNGAPCWLLVEARATASWCRTGTTSWGFGRFACWSIFRVGVFGEVRGRVSRAGLLPPP